MVKPSKIDYELASVRRDARIAHRWGGDSSVFQGGFLSVPTRFLRGYALARVPITTEEAMFLLQLMTFKWAADRPYPSYQRLGRIMGVHARTVARYASSLEKKGYLSRNRRQGTTNQFDLTPLFERIRALPMTRSEERDISEWVKSEAKDETPTKLQVGPIAQTDRAP